MNPVVGCEDEWVDLNKVCVTLNVRLVQLHPDVYRNLATDGVEVGSLHPGLCSFLG